MADLESMTKAELEEHAAGMGAEVNSGMTKAEMIAAIEAKEGEAVSGDFVTPRQTITAVTGRDKMAEALRTAVIEEAAAAAGGGADQGSLGGTGGTTISPAGGAGAGGGGGGGVTTGPA